MSDQKGPKATVTDVTERITLKANKTEGIINYDVDNAYPQRVDDIINSSGTGSLCSNMLRKFLFGEGFSNELLAELTVNRKGLKGNKLLFKLAQSLSKKNGIAVHINYNMNFKKLTLGVMPFNHCRTTDPEDKKNKNKIAVYDDWYKKRRRNIDLKAIKYFDTYNPDPKVILEQVEKAGGWRAWSGQIMYLTTEGLNEYVLAPTDPVLEDLQTDSHAKIFKNRNITTNFMASYIIETLMFENEGERQDFIDNLVNFQGSDNALKFMLIEKMAGQKEPSIDLKKIDIQDVEKLFEFTENSVRDNIIRQFLIPHILLIAIPGKMGTSSERQEAFAEYNGTTKEGRIFLMEVIKELMNESVFSVGDDFDIIELNPNVLEAKDTAEGKKEIVNLLANAALSEPQKLKVLELVYDYTVTDAMQLISTRPGTEEGSEEAVDEEAKARATLRGSVGGVQAILSIQQSVSEGKTDRGSGIAILEVVFGYTKLEAQQILGDPEAESNLTVTS